MKPCYLQLAGFLSSAQSRPEVLNSGPWATFGLQGNQRPHRADPDSFISSTGDDPPADGKILFKKPAKRSSEDKFQGITASSSKKKRNDGGEKTQDEQKEVKSGKKIKNKSLLSFGGDEEEEEDWMVSVWTLRPSPVSERNQWLQSYSADVLCCPDSRVDWSSSQIMFMCPTCIHGHASYTQEWKYSAFSSYNNLNT